MKGLKKMKFSTLTTLTKVESGIYTGTIKSITEPERLANRLEIKIQVQQEAGTFIFSTLLLANFYDTHPLYTLMQSLGYNVFTMQNVDADDLCGLPVEFTIKNRESKGNTYSTIVNMRALGTAVQSVQPDKPEEVAEEDGKIDF